MGTQFILHILLPMGSFNRTRLNSSCNRDFSRSTKLIGELDDENSLQEYSNILLCRFIGQQLLFFTNTKRTIHSSVIEAEDFSTI